MSENIDFTEDNKMIQRFVQTYKYNADFHYQYQRIESNRIASHPCEVAAEVEEPEQRKWPLHCIALHCIGGFY